MGYVPVIGLEIHAELLTNSKVFCSCSSEFGGSENSHCCPVCTGLPGTLPVLNKTAVEFAIKAGLAMGCEINRYSRFDRKNYFYPDLPKAYQISQLDYPLCINGAIEIEGKTIRINRIHLEEDAGKLIHDDFDNVSLADYNRCSVPLIEIVTEPDIRSSQEAKAFVEAVIAALAYTEVCDCKMEQGSLRVDVNVSVMEESATKFGTRTEMKNLNSIKAVVRAIEYEIERQIDVITKGGRVIQETRSFNLNHGKTKPLRSKENAQDYRYFPDPDIVAVNIDDSDIERIRSTIPELAPQRVERYMKDYSLSEADCSTLVSKKVLSDFFEECLKIYNNHRIVANYVVNEIPRYLDMNNATSMPISAEDFTKTLDMADKNEINRESAKTVIRLMFETGKSADEIIKENNFKIEDDKEAIIAVIEEILNNNPKAVGQYIAGDKRVFGYLMGESNKFLKGSASPKAVKETLEEELGKRVSM